MSIKIRISLRKLLAIATTIGLLLLVLINFRLAFLIIIILIPSVFLTSYLSSKMQFNIFELLILANTLLLTLTILTYLLLKLLNISGLFSITINVIMVILLIVMFGKKHFLENIKKNIFLNSALAVSIIVALVASIASLSVSRTYLPDETSYAYAAQLLGASGYTFVHKYPVLGQLEKFFGSRLLWITYLFYIHDFMNTPPTELYRTTSLFLSLLVPVVMGFFHDIFKIDRIEYNILLTFSTLFHPLVILWGLTILIDVPESYFILSFMYFTLNGFKNLERGCINVNFEHLLISFVYLLIIVFLLRYNIITISLLVFMLVLYIYLNLRQMSERRHYLLLMLIANMIMYIIAAILVIDVTYFICIHILKNVALAVFLRRFLILGISLTEQIIGWFVSYPWKPKTVFSYSASEWFARINYAITPEMNGLFTASMLILPICLSNCKPKVRILCAALLTSFWMGFMDLMLSDNFHDISRYYLHIYVIVTMYTLSEIYNSFLNISTPRKIFKFPLCALIPLLINYIVTVNFGGTSFFWIIKPYPYSTCILSLKLIAITSIITIAFLKYKNSNIKKLNIFLFLIIFINMIHQVLFIRITVQNDFIVFTNDVEVLEQLSSNIKMFLNNDVKEPVIIVSNFHAFLRNFFNPSKFIVLPVPLNVNDFHELISIIPEKSLIVITNNYRFSYYSLINKYINNIILEKEVEYHNGVRITNMYTTRFNNFYYSIFVKEDQRVSVLAKNASITLSFIWENRTCKLNAENLSGKNAIIYTVKFSYVIHANTSYILFPYIDSDTSIPMAYQICYMTFLIDSSGVKPFGFGKINLDEICTFFAMHGVLLLFSFYLVSTPCKDKLLRRWRRFTINDVCRPH